MCGIAGLFGRSDASAVGSMLSAMGHRGPDDRGVFTDEAVALGHLRLSIQDPSPAGHQPMSAAEGSVWVSFNGEIYNFVEERARLELEGDTFASGSDTEVLLRLYLKHGTDFVRRLRGIFAFAIYDKRRGRGREMMMLGRDPFGVKPLLYVEQNGILAFASELKGLLASGLVRPEISSRALRGLLSLGSVHQPATLLNGVRSIPSAHYLIVDASGTRLQRYWSFGLDRVRGMRSLPYQDQVDAVAEAMTTSVRLQRVSDVPVGAFLSGGVDSSLLVALMAAQTGSAVQTFSVGYQSASLGLDESEDAAAMASYLGTHHHRVIVEEKSVSRDLDRFTRALDQPSVDGLNSYYVSQAAAGSVKVALSGTGADEVFLGYPWFAQLRAEVGADALRAPRLPAWMRRLLAPAPHAVQSRIPQALGELYHCFGPQEAAHLLTEERRAATAERSFAEDLGPLDELPDAAPLDRAGVLCLNGYTRNQLLRDIDACSMSHSLEVRVPFLDTSVVDLALSLPVESKLAFGERSLDLSASYSETGAKRILVDVARRWLPGEFFQQRAKRGFSLPHAEWLRGPLCEVLDDTLSPESVRRAGLFAPDAVASVRKGFLAGERPWVQPWLLMVTELWRRSVLTGTPELTGALPQEHPRESTGLRPVRFS
jgi:asparagine synthase (glutamine-hydrolysing)